MKNSLALSCEAGIFVISTQTKILEKFIQKLIKISKIVLFINKIVENIWPILDGGPKNLSSALPGQI